MEKRREEDNIYLWHLIRLFLRAETNIINEIGRLRSKGLADYHAEAALSRVQNILKKLKADGWEYVPKMIEWEFYVNHPENRIVPEAVSKHEAAYHNAKKMTGTQTRVAEILTRQLMMEIDDATRFAQNNLESIILGRKNKDSLRTIGLKTAMQLEAEGKDSNDVKEFLNNLAMEGVTSFVDKAGREWRLSTYGTMLLRTSTQQARVMAVLTQNPDHDLYQISTIGSTCGICAPLEGRVYSKSGLDPDFPPLASAYGKIDKDGPNTLENTWLNIHPNCRHALIQFTLSGKSDAEIEKIKKFSSFVTNPITNDPRSQAQIEQYRETQRARRKFNADYKQWERYRERIPDLVPKSFTTFMQHKSKNDAKYQEWLSAFRSAAV